MLHNLWLSLFFLLWFSNRLLQNLFFNTKTALRDFVSREKIFSKVFTWTIFFRVSLLRFNRKDSNEKKLLSLTRSTIECSEIKSYLKAYVSVFAVLTFLCLYERLTLQQATGYSKTQVKCMANIQ